MKSFSERLKELTEFCEKNNRLPNSHNSRDEGRLVGFMYSYGTNKSITDLRNKYKRRLGVAVKDMYDKYMNDLIEFCRINNRLPNNGPEEWKLRVFMSSYKDDIKVREIVDKYKKKKPVI